MNTIKKIFKNDIKSVFSNFFVLVIFLGVCFIPALYAWCNIYSNWDPYSNTGNLKMAAVSMDKGYEDADGNMLNIGDGLMDSLKENDAIDWEFVESDEAALEGVRRGDYYGAVVVPEDFTGTFFDALEGEVHHPKLIFYQNQKKNPVANKITDTVVEKLKSSIDQKVIDMLASTIFTKAGDISVEIKDADSIDKLIGKIEEVNSDLDEYQAQIQAIIEANASIQTALDYADSGTQTLIDRTTLASQDIANARYNIKDAKSSITDYIDSMNKLSLTLSDRIDNLLDKVGELDKTKNVDEINAKITEISNELSDIEITLETLNTSIPDTQIYHGLRLTIQDMNGTLNTISSIITEINTSVSDKIDTDKAKGIIADKRSSLSSNVNKLKSIASDRLMPQLSSVLKSVGGIIDGLNISMNRLVQALGGMSDVYNSLSDTIDSTDSTLENISDAIGGIESKLDNIVGVLQAIKGSDLVDRVIESVSTDPANYGEFFSSPVSVEDNILYPVKNYGSAVAPFYTVLAIWVGCLLLTAILRTKPDMSRYEGASDVAVFFGRYLIFMIAGFIQAFIIVMGDFYLLKIQCVEKGYFLLAALFTSFVFSLFIYSLVNAFGDIGKCFAVVMVVIQIAGSSGTYPIELLPAFFKNVYLFFPFPYAIDAVRECVAGMYGNEYTHYLLRLGIYIPVALVIGVFIRRAFSGINEYIEERMEETGMM